MRAPTPTTGSRIETLPHVGVARGVILGRVQVDARGREVWRWKARVVLPSGDQEDVFLLRGDFEVLPGPKQDPEEAALERRAKRRGGGA